MHQITRKNDLNKITHLPKAIYSIAETTINMMDREYGENRDVFKDNGGYIIVLENNDKIEMLKDLGFDIDCLCSEYTEEYKTEEGSFAYSVLYLGSDFLVTLLMPYSMALSLDGFLG